MQRVISVVVLLCLMFNASVVHAAQQPMDWKQAYKTQIINYIYSDAWDQTSEISLFDIDQDGVPELFAGSSYRMSSHIAMAYTFKKGKIIPLTHKGPGQGYGSSNGIKLGMPSFSLFKDQKTGKYKVFASDGQSGAATSSGGEYLIQLNGTVLTTTEISTYISSDENGDSYTYEGKKVSKTQYDANRKKYFAPLTDMKKKTLQLFGNADMLDQTLAYYEHAVNKFLQIETVDKSRIYMSTSGFIKDYNRSKGDDIETHFVIESYDIKK